VAPGINTTLPFRAHGLHLFRGWERGCEGSGKRVIYLNIRVLLSKALSCDRLPEEI